VHDTGHRNSYGYCRHECRSDFLSGFQFRKLDKPIFQGNRLPQNARSRLCLALRASAKCPPRGIYQPYAFSLLNLRVKKIDRRPLPLSSSGPRPHGGLCVNVGPSSILSVLDMDIGGTQMHPRRRRLMVSAATSSAARPVAQWAVSASDIDPRFIWVDKPFQNVCLQF
jgi:hypothetical protein